MRTTTKKAAEAIDINEIADLYQKLSTEAKEITKRADGYKKKLIEFAKANRAKFADNMLKFPNGVYVECRVALKGTFNQDSATLEWMEKMIDRGFGYLITININDKEALKNTQKDLAKLLKEIHFECEEKETLAVYGN